MVKVAVVSAACHENGVGGKAGPVVQGWVCRGGGKGDIHRAGLQQAQNLGAAAADDLQPDARVLAVEGVQVFGEEEAGDGVAGTDDQSTQQQLLSLGELVLSRGNEAQGAAHVLVEHLTLAGEGHAPGAAGKEAGLQRRFQLLDGLAYGRLGDIQVFRRHGDVAGVGHFLEYAV